MAAPGAGAGNQAAARAALKGIFPYLYKLQSAFPVASEDWENIQMMIKHGGKIVGNTEGDSIVPSAIQKMLLEAKQGGPLKNAPPVGIQPAPANGNVAAPQEPEPV
jgi:hypothetical protein